MKIIYINVFLVWFGFIANALRLCAARPSNQVRIIPTLELIYSLGVVPFDLATLGQEEESKE